MNSPTPNTSEQQSAQKSGIYALCEKQLETLIADVPGIRVALVSTGDGLPIASSGSDRTLTNKLAAMTSSKHALAEALFREAKLGVPTNVIIESEEGTILMTSVPTQKGRKLVVSVVADNTTVLGKLLWATRTMCATLAKSLQSSENAQTAA